MKQLIALFIAAGCAVALNTFAENYSTEATITPHKDKGTYELVAVISQLIEKNGKQVEKVISRPRINTSPGVPASLCVGPSPKQADYQTAENINVDVSWPYPNESGVAFCAITIKRGDKVVSKSRLQLQIEGPGRSPLVVAARDVDPGSVRVVDEKSTPFVLLEFKGKTKEEVKKIANENYGNKVQVRDLQGRTIEGGRSFGTHKEIGMAVQYESKSEAEQAAGILRGENSR